MLFFWVVLIVGVLGVSFYSWPRDQRSLRLVITTGAIVGALTGGAMLIAQALPVTHKVTVERVVHTKYVKPPQIVYRDKTVYQIPGKELEPVDTKKVCKGGGTLILDQVTKTGTKDGDWTTWVLARVPGSKVQITCRIPGSYDDFLKVGSVVQMPANGDNQ